MSQSQIKTQEILKSTTEATAVKSSPEEVEESLRLIEDLKFFLATAPANWQENQIIRRYYLNNDQGFVSCVFWNNLYYVTGTDIVKCCVYRMQKFGRQVIDRKKFEEGIFSDLRNLKCGVDATLEMPKSDFLSFLFKNMCLKTQKKQKVFFWFSVPHDKLFADALERDLKRHNAGHLPTTRPVSEPALSFSYDEGSGISLYEQLLRHMDSQRKAGSPSTSALSAAGEPSRVSFPSTNNRLHDAQPTIPQEADEEEEELETPIPTLGDRAQGEISTNYAPQELVINPSENTPGNRDFENDSATRLSDLISTVKEEDDFPLDYFPVEIEYPGQDQNQPTLNSAFYDNDMESQMVPLSAIPPLSAGFYENHQFPEEMAMIPQPVNSAARFAFQIPPPPMSAARSNFVTNGEYYASFMKDVPDRDQKNIEKQTLKNNDVSERGDDSNDEDAQKEPQSHQKPSHDPRIFQTGYPYAGYISGKMPYSVPDAQFVGSDPYLTRGYTMEDFMCDNSAVYLPDSFSLGAYPSGQNMQVPGMSNRPFTPGFRMTPIASTAPFMSIAQYNSKQGPSNSYPINPYYQPSPHFQRWGNVHGYLRGFPSIQATSAPQGTPIQPQRPISGTRMHFSKPGKINKSSRIQKPVQRPKGKSQSILSKLKNTDVSNHHKQDKGSDYEHAYSMPTPDSHVTVASENQSKANYASGSGENDANRTVHEVLENGEQDKTYYH